jgi:hypothetical protein
MGYRPVVKASPPIHDNIRQQKNTVTDSRKGGHCYLHGNEGNKLFQLLKPGNS